MKQNVTNLPLGTTIPVRAINVREGDRFVVSLALSYGYSDAVATIEDAAAAALAYTRDRQLDESIWTVEDRETGEIWMLDQMEFEGRIDDNDMLR